MAVINKIIRSIAPDGKEVLSNILDQYTGKLVEFREIDYIPEEYDGIIYIKNNNKNYKRVFDGVVNPLWFGAVGDGIADDTSAIRKALNSGYKVSADDKNTFFITETIGVTDKNVNIENINLKISEEGRLIINSSSKKVGVVDNTVTLNEGDYKIPLDDTSNIEIGDLIYFKTLPQTTGDLIKGKRYIITKEGGNFTSVGAPDNNLNTDFVATGVSADYGIGGELLPLWAFDPRPARTNVTEGEVHKVRSIEGNNVILDIPLMATYYNSYNIQYSVYKLYECNISNLNVYADEAGPFGFMSISRRSPTIKNCTFDRVSGTAGISIGLCYNARILHTTIKDGFYEGTSTGYGIQCSGSTGTYVGDRCILLNNRRGVDFSGSTPSKLGTVENCIVTGANPIFNTGSCIGEHGGSDLTTYKGNTLIGSIIGVQLRGYRSKILNNTFRGQTNCSIYSADMIDVHIEGNIQESFNKKFEISHFIDCRCNTGNDSSIEKPFKIINNYCESIARNFVRIQNSEKNESPLNGLIILDNTINLKSNGFYDVHFINNPSDIKKIEITNSNINNNSINVFQGKYSIISEDSIEFGIRNKGDFVIHYTPEDLLPSFSSANLTDVKIDLKTKVDKDNFVTIVGDITFTVEGQKTAVKIKKLHNSPNICVQTLEGNNLLLATNTLYIGSDIGDHYNNAFDIGTHTVSLDLKFKITRGYEYGHKE